MTDVLRHSSTCFVRQEKSSREVEAVVQEFKVKDRLIVVLNQSVKLNMKWNGQVYEGRMAGLDFISHGPTFNTTKTSIRG